MKRRDCLGLLAACSGALPRFAPAQPRQVWRLPTGYRADSFHGRTLAEFASDVGQSSGGALAIELQPNNSRFKLAEIFGAVRAGQAEAGETIMTGLAAQFPVAGADAVPFVVRSYADAERLWRCQRPLIEEQFAALGLVSLYAVPWPPQGLYSTRPVVTSADLRGLRMRTYNATTVRIAQGLGALPVDVPMVEVGAALAAGRFECMITSAVTGVENQVWKQLRHYYPIDAWFPKNIVFAAAARVAALPEPARAALAAAAQRAEQRGWAASRAALAESLDELRRRGMTIEPVASEFRRELARLGERFSLDWIRAVGPDANRIFIPYYTAS